MANSMNKLKQELSRVTGKTYKEIQFVHEAGLGGEWIE